MPSRRLLVLTYHWPPFAGAGAARWSAMARHLRGLGHEVTVITTSLWGPPPPDDGEGVIHTRDLAATGALRKLLRRPSGEEPAAAPAAGRPGEDLRSRALVPDPFVVSWVPFAAAVARRVIRHHPVDCVITSSPPDSVHLAGLALRGRRAAWIADLRDGWRFEPLKPRFPTSAQGRLDARLEARVAREADALVTVTQPIADDLERRLGAETTVIPNAWDPDLEAEVAEANTPPLPQGKFSFVHTGTLSGEWGRDPAPLIRGFAALLVERPELRERIRIVLVGRPRINDLRALSGAGLDDVVEQLGSLPRPSAVALQRQADALLLVTSRNRGEATGKLFEYLASGRPIIALAAENEAARIVQETGTGRTVSPDDDAAVLAALRAAVNGELEAEYSPRGVESYRYPGPAERLSQVVEEGIATAGRTHGPRDGSR